MVAKAKGKMPPWMMKGDEAAKGKPKGKPKGKMPMMDKGKMPMMEKGKAKGKK